MFFEKLYINIITNLKIIICSQNIMSITLTLNGNSSLLTSQYFPPIDLKGNYVCGLVDFQTYNSIPNVDIDNNKFHIGKKIITIPVGSYEIEDIEKYIRRALGIDDNIKSSDSADRKTFDLKANNNTLKCEIYSDVGDIDFTKERSICKLLGFSKRILDNKKLHISDLYVDINRVNTIRVECNIIGGTYINNQQAHILHEFSIKVSPGYKIIEVPLNVIYLPLNVERLTSLILKLTDQDGNLLNFRGENITTRLHLKLQT